ncbi:unnamed protein product, partial [Ectocarpus fasciculatus]
SPILRNIPSDPADRRSFEFSPSPMPAQYLAEGTASQDHRRHSPSPHGYTAREVPALYPHRYGYNIGGSFAHSDPEVPAAKQQQQLAFKPSSSCRCQQHQCSCNSSSSKTAQKDSSSSEPPPAMWRNSNKGGGGGDDANMTTARPGLFHGEAPAQQPPAAVSVSAPSRSPSPSAAILAQNQQQQQQHNSSRVMPRTIELTSSPAKKSDWENLLGAVDLELRAQQRSEFVPDSTPATPVPSHHYAHAINAAHLHHQHQPLDDAPPLLGGGGGGSGGGYTQQQPAAASVSPEFGPIKTAPAPAARHHRRGGGPCGDDYSGGGPAYSGSTADAACLLATLPQRMLDRATTSSSSKNHHHHHQTANSAAAAAAAAAAATMGGGVGMMPPALVSASGPPVTPVRVQASGRRGPRGQSRFKGVCITRAGKWRAVIYIGRKQKYLGVFDSEFDAARAYDAAALQHFAEGAKLNFPDGVERQLNDISSVSGRPFATAGAGGAAAPRSCTPPAAYLESHAAAAASPSSSAKRSRKTAFGDHDEDGWVREDGPWHPSRR